MPMIHVRQGLYLVNKYAPQMSKQFHIRNNRNKRVFLDLHVSLICYLINRYIDVGNSFAILIQSIRFTIY